MTEYALILAAIAVVVFGLYQTLGTQTTSFVQTVIDLF
jgi:Flp pilus assembly pilin Flp